MKEDNWTCWNSGCNIYIYNINTYIIIYTYVIIHNIYILYTYKYIYIHIIIIYMNFRLTNKAAKKLGASSEDSPFLRPQPVQRLTQRSIGKAPGMAMSCRTNTIGKLTIFPNTNPLESQHTPITWQHSPGPNNQWHASSFWNSCPSSCPSSSS